MDGFFASAPLHSAFDPNDEGIDSFAQAIAGRFDNSDRNLLTARLSPALTLCPSTPANVRMGSAPNPSLPATPLARMSISMSPRSTMSSSSAASSSSTATSNNFSIATATTLPEIVRTPRVLILDIRPHSAYSAARLPHAISLSVPSTLLKRPAFTLQKLATMLPSSTARSRFQAWNNASRILVYDADSVALHDGSNLLGLLRKFRAEGFTGDIAWLQGGIQALWRDQRHLVDESAVSDEEEETESPRFLRARDLPSAAFQQFTTAPVGSRTGSSSTLPGSRFSSSVPNQPQATSCHPPTRLAATIPFYDNIRQNIELSQGITERIPLRLSPTVASRARDLPFSWLRNIAASAGRDEGTEALAVQFYRIELDEQKRMQGVMAHHSMQSSTMDSTDDSGTKDKEETVKDAPFPYSIVAGVEKGTKNRYRNIWPFEHTRVRLLEREQDDYVNASFIQPLGTRRQYIATQGPLPSTFSDFWTVIWEQNVRIIVMLTRECEGGSIKCGNYWSSGQYGPFILKCISASDVEDSPSKGSSMNSGGGFFDVSSMEVKGGLDGRRANTNDDGERNDTIRRTFELSHAEHPELKPRIIHHLQYLGWPDMDVPVSPKGLLQLMFEVDELVDSTNERTGASPALFHCSAGVGRTGAFIMIDAVLDGIRREVRKRTHTKRAAMVRQSLKNGSSDSESESRNGSTDAMEVDSYRNLVSFVSTRESVRSDPLLSRSQNSSSTPRAARANETTEAPQVVHTQTGPFATLHMGGDKSRRPDIHVPLVPSTAEPQTPRPFQIKESVTGFSPPLNMQSSLARSSPSLSRLHAPASPLSRQRPNLFARRVLTSDFTVADADSMFTSPSLNPAFAMDVESLQPPSQQVMSSSSSGEGNVSGGERMSSGSGSGSSSSSSGRMMRPMQLALERLSSADDIPGSTERSDSDSFVVPTRFTSRVRAGSGSGSGSGSGEGGRSASSSSASGGKSGGYSSTSSLGLRGFAGLGVSSSSDHSPSASTGTTAPSASRPQLSALPRKPSAQKTNLLAPKPLHPIQSTVPELISSSKNTQRAAPALPSRLRPEKHLSSSSVRSNMSSPSSAPSSADNLSSVCSNPVDSSVTPPSMHGTSRSPSPEKGEIITHEDGPAFDYLSPRNLHGEDSPPLLSSLQEPIRQILGDMREQRMSLCQSLRQYVFVHNAIIEGALLIVEEERKRAGVEDMHFFDSDTSSIASELSKGLLTGKRGASPTELLKEDKKGEVALAKRPSVKRGKSSSSGDSTGSA